MKQGKCAVSSDLSSDHLVYAGDDSARLLSILLFYHCRKFACDVHGNDQLVSLNML